MKGLVKEVRTLEAAVSRQVVRPVLVRVQELLAELVMKKPRVPIQLPQLSQPVRPGALPTAELLKGKLSCSMLNSLSVSAREAVVYALINAGSEEAEGQDVQMEDLFNPPSSQERAPLSSGRLPSMRDSSVRPSEVAEDSFTIQEDFEPASKKALNRPRRLSPIGSGSSRNNSRSYSYSYGSSPSFQSDFKMQDSASSEFKRLQAECRGFLKVYDANSSDSDM